MQKILLTIAVLSLTACAQYGGYQPTVDTYGSKNSGYLDRDLAECRNLAEQASGGFATKSGIGLGIGAIGGAAAGAAIGAIAGDPAIGAAIGGAAGGLGGAAHQGIDSDSKYRYAYQNCLERRGHTVIR